MRGDARRTPGALTYSSVVHTCSIACATREPAALHRGRRQDARREKARLLCSSVRPETAILSYCMVVWRTTRGGADTCMSMMTVCALPPQLRGVAPVCLCLAVAQRDVYEPTEGTDRVAERRIEGGVAGLEWRVFRLLVSVWGCCLRGALCEGLGDSTCRFCWLDW